MSDLGLMLAWSAVQVSLVLLAATALHALAARHSPASGAWVAAMGLGLAMVVGFVSPGLRGRTPTPVDSPDVRQASPTPASRVSPAGPEPADAAAPDRPMLTLATLRALWERLDRTAAVPAARCRPWGRSWRSPAWPGPPRDCSGCLPASGLSISSDDRAGPWTTPSWAICCRASWMRWDAGVGSRSASRRT